MDNYIVVGDPELAPDVPSTSIDASEVSYTNTKSGLSATTVQSAIDEVTTTRNVFLARGNITSNLDADVIYKQGQYWLDRGTTTPYTDNLPTNVQYGWLTVFAPSLNAGATALGSIIQEWQAYGTRYVYRRNRINNTWTSWWLAYTRQDTVIASNEPTSKSSQAYSSGQYMIRDGNLKKVTSAIARGESITGNNTSNTTVGEELRQLNSDLTLNNEKTISLTTSQYESIDPANNFTPTKTGLYLVKLHYHNDEPLELRVGTTSNYKNSQYIVNQPVGNLGELNLICFLNAGVGYSIGTRYANGGIIDNNAGYIQRLITIS